MLGRHHNKQALKEVAMPRLTNVDDVGWLPWQQPWFVFGVVHDFGRLLQKLSQRIVSSQYIRQGKEDPEKLSNEVALRCFQDVIDDMVSLESNLKQEYGSSARSCKSHTRDSILITSHFLKGKLSLMKVGMKGRQLRVAKKQLSAVLRLESSAKYLQESIEERFELQHCPPDAATRSDSLVLAECIARVAVDCLGSGQRQDLATNLMYMSLRIYQRLDSHTPVVDLAVAHINMAHAFWSVGMLDRGREMCRKALALLLAAEAQDTARAQKDYMETLAKCYRFLGHTSRDDAAALSYYQLELEIHEKQRWSGETTAAVHVEIAACLCSTSPERSLQHSEQALLLTQCSLRTVDIYINMAAALALAERKVEARKYLLQAKEMTEEMIRLDESESSDEETQMRATRQMLSICGSLGRLDDEDGEPFGLPLENGSRE
ncbi:expressed unknown protein [Seminavis robusta]|uniref:Uncharacterized protein n=1 Tax=Seminavis robusta TaxID=568900 RepID=A0A9N8DU71_9STRA|nr:expressed unknown protein [Seminavis robusta]|eukprot:Sro282_g107470.1 n/a (433) ;mRNA; f:33244-34542